MLFADYEFYTCIYHGTLAGPEFSRLVVPASAYINRETFGQIQAPVPIEVKYAVCALIDVMQKIESNDMNNISSKTAGSTSVSYFDPLICSQDASKRMKNAILPYLETTNLLGGWL